MFLPVYGKVKSLPENTQKIYLLITINELVLRLSTHNPHMHSLYAYTIDGSTYLFRSLN